MPVWELWLSINWRAERASHDVQRLMWFGERLKRPASSSSMKMAVARACGFASRERRRSRDESCPEEHAPIEIGFLTKRTQFYSTERIQS